MSKWLLTLGIIFYAITISAKIAAVDEQNSEGGKAIEALEHIPAPFYVENQKGNRLTLLNSGLVAFQKRLDLIRQAKSSIDVEYFIYSIDQAGRIFTHELVKAARRGVKIRILVDKSAPVFELNKYYAKALASEGIEVRYYNIAPLIRFSTSQFRSHRKLFLVDDKVAIIGGRNMADEYYDFSTKFNFLDRDVIVEGPVVPIIKDSFEQFWNNKMTKKVRLPRRPQKPVAHSIADEILNPDYIEAFEEYQDDIKIYNKNMHKAFAYLKLTDEDRSLLQRLEQIARPILKDKRTYECPKLTYATDRPGANGFVRWRPSYTDKFRVVRKAISKMIMQAKERVLLSSPYFISNLKAKMVYDNLLDKSVEVTIYTNSLGSTDAIYVASNFYRDVFRWQKDGVIPYIHSGKWIPLTDVVKEGVKQAKWGTHSKTHVYDDDTIMIGTYNVDTRSNFYNAEMAIFCRGNRELVSAVRASIERRMHSGYKIVGNHKAVDKEGNYVDVLGEASRGSRVLMTVLAIPSWIFSYLL